MASEFAFSDLSPAEKLLLVEDLWDDLAANPGDVPVHEWQKELLASRRAELEAHPESALTWEEVKRRLAYTARDANRWQTRLP